MDLQELSDKLCISTLLTKFKTSFYLCFRMSEDGSINNVKKKTETFINERHFTFFSIFCLHCFYF